MACRATVGSSAATAARSLPIRFCGTSKLAAKMTKGKLYGDAKNFHTQKALIAAKLFNVEVEVAGAEAPADKFPLGVTPAFESGDVLLFGAESIALHFAKTTCPEVVQWLQWGQGELLPAVLSHVLHVVSAVQVDKKAADADKAELLAQLKHFNDVLVSRTFLAGDRFGVADVSVALNLLPAYQYALDSAARKELVNVNRWFLTVVNQPAVKEVIGDFAFIEKAAVFDAAKFKELSAKAKPAPKKAEAKKKEEKKKPAAEELDAADEAVRAEPKAADPFAAMPKGTFVMDDWKRCYSNEDTEKVAIPYFWKNFDSENYSIWFGEYKYPEDLSLTFMSCNLISGMFQRLEKLKKNAFASVCLFGTDNNSTISGVWVWRGHELAFPLSPDWTIDYESYDWKKLDPKDEATQKMVNAYFAWEGDFGGDRKFNQGKIFK
ncbi:hypothetical protein QR680_005169 [Steinernema hermaphroditum]|uniref:eEF-1B gamma n=1 Tax=Steinernema hermaphroditum TaxID=289476 RepID=A0AA39HTA8_9BILA|nr:hypothetical protein QR680_005169 [Steinernema hermaphroditum]